MFGVEAELRGRIEALEADAAALRRALLWRDPKGRVIQCRICRALTPVVGTLEHKQGCPFPTTDAGKPLLEELEGTKRTLVQAQQANTQHARERVTLLEALQTAHNELLAVDTALDWVAKKQGGRLRSIEQQQTELAKKDVVVEAVGVWHKEVIADHGRAIARSLGELMMLDALAAHDGTEGT